MRARARVPGARPGGRRRDGAAAKPAGRGCPGARDSRCVTEQKPTAARGSQLLLTHQKAVHGRGGFGAPGAGKSPMKRLGGGRALQRGAAWLTAARANLQRSLLRATETDRTVPR